MGKDTALETEEETISRTKKNNFVIFDRAVEEQRLLLTTSKRLLERSNCPLHTAFVNPQKLEPSLIGLFQKLDISLNPDEL